MAATIGNIKELRARTGAGMVDYGYQFGIIVIYPRWV